MQQILLELKLVFGTLFDLLTNSWPWKFIAQFSTVQFWSWFVIEPMTVILSWRIWTDFFFSRVIMHSFHIDESKIITNHFGLLFLFSLMLKSTVFINNFEMKRNTFYFLHTQPVNIHTKSLANSNISVICSSTNLSCSKDRHHAHYKNNNWCSSVKWNLFGSDGWVVNISSFKR